MSRLAAIDVGTNTVRLLVVEADMSDVTREQTITRLGAGVDRTKTLDPKAIERTLDAIAAYAARARQLGAGSVRIAGTSALRDASNSADLAEAVVARTGIVLEVIGGHTEGRCAYSGATSRLPGGNYVVCDIGGGSTELITADAEVSIDIGSVRLRERVMGSDPPTPDELAAARSMAADALDEAVSSIAPGEDARLVGVAGTITTLCALVLGLETYDGQRVHGATLKAADIADWSSKLARMTVEEIKTQLPVVQAGRSDVIASGSLILVEVMRSLGASEVVVSEYDILDGLVLDLAERLA